MSTRVSPPPRLDPRPAPAAWGGGAAAPARGRHPLGWVEGFVLLLLLCQIALIFLGGGPLRLAIRIAAFGSSLGLLLLLRGRGGRHPATTPAVLVLLVVGIGVVHPGTSSSLAGVAQAALYAAVIAPLFWVARLAVDLRALRRVVFILWGFHTLSSGLGVLQVYRPGTFQPALSAVVTSKGKGYVESLKFTTASGQRVFRPMGLTDVPGGAGISGLYAVLFGIGFFLTRRTPGMLAASAASMGLGIMCLYLAQVRALVVMTGVAIVAVSAILAWRRDVGRLLGLGSALLVVVVAGYTAASGMMGRAALNRMNVLVRDRPGQVYYSNRGHFLEDAFTRIIPKHPLGAGLGHWGMSATYFGRPNPNATETFWVEIQWAGWAVDGGLPLMAAYLAALAAALWTAWRIARAPPPPGGSDLPFWGAIVLAHGVGAVALTFSYPIFVAQAGMEFWLLNATLFAAARWARAAPASGAEAGRA